MEPVGQSVANKRDYFLLMIKHSVRVIFPFFYNQANIVIYIYQRIKVHFAIFDVNNKEYNISHIEQLIQ